MTAANFSTIFLRSLLTWALFFSFSQSLDGQSICKQPLSEFLEEGWRSTKNTLGAPAQWRTREYLILGFTAAGVGVALTQDAEFQGIVTETPTSFRDGMAFMGEKFGNPLFLGGGLLMLYSGGCLFDQPRLSEATWKATQALLISGFITQSLKMMFNRQRPLEGSPPDPHRWFNGSPWDRTNKSFPSGHTTAAFAWASAFSEYYKDKIWVGAVLYPLAGLTAWSRMYDNKHWLSDVLAGAAIGIFTGKMVNRTDQLRFSVAPGLNGNLQIGVNLSW